MYFLYPNVLFLMLLPILILFFLISTNKSKFEKVFNEETLKKLATPNKYLSKQTRNILLFIALICMTVALSRPVIDNKEDEKQISIIPVVFAIDISKSMLAQDLYPNRIEFSKKKILDILNQNKNISIGVIIFAKYSYIVSPITNDFSSLKYLVNNFSQNLNISDGSSILRALEASNRLLEKFPSKNLILLSDGGNKENYEDEIEFSKQNNITVYSIGMAGSEPSPIPDKDGYLTDSNNNIVTVSLNDKIKELSLQTGGAYADYTIDSKDIDAIINDIIQTSEESELQAKKLKVYTELFYYPLGLAVFILLFAFSSFPKRSSQNTNIAALFIVAFFIHSNELQAVSLFDFEKLKDAKEAYSNKDYEKSSNIFSDFINKNEGKYNFANSLYKEKKYESALKAYQDIETVDENLEFKKLHNMGNTYVKLNKLEDAKKMYEKALNIKEDDETRKNLEIVNDALENQKQDNQQNQQNQNQEKNQDNQEQNSQDSQNEQQQGEENAQQNQSQASQKQANEEINNNIISQKEEEKWLKRLENKKSGVLLQRIEPKAEESQDNSSPW